MKLEIKELAYYRTWNKKPVRVIHIFKSTKSCIVEGKDELQAMPLSDLVDILTPEEIPEYLKPQKGEINGEEDEYIGASPEARPPVQDSSPYSSGNWMGDSQESGR